MLQATQARVSLTRLQELLTAPEMAASSSLGGSSRGASSADAGPDAAGLGDAAAAAEGVQAHDVAIRIRGDFTWDPDKPPTLTDLDLTIPK